MPNPFIRKLTHGAVLTEDDRALLAEASRDSRQIGPRQDIISQGERPDHVHLVMQGYACRYKLLRNGKRQNMALLVPGDLCDIHVTILGAMDHSIATLSACRVVRISQTVMLDLMANPRINRALWWANLVDEGTLREWLVSMGQRDAMQQMGHLFCELLARLRAVGRADETGFDWPVTQDDLADTLGMTAVHVNRTLQALRDAGLLAVRDKRVSFPDEARLRDLSGFDPNYLHLKPS